MKKQIIFLILGIAVIQLALALTIEKDTIIQPNAQSAGHYTVDNTFTLNELIVDQTDAQFVGLADGYKTVCVYDANQVLESCPCIQSSDCTVPETSVNKHLTFKANTDSEIYCDNNIDEDGDGLIDCQDNECPSACSGQCVASVCNDVTYDWECISDDSLCDDGRYCNGAEYCDPTFRCRFVTPIDCSANNLAAITDCNNDPDINPLTFDYFAGFTSTCDEINDECTTATVDLTHSCDITQCSAECETDVDCTATECDTLDGCVLNDYYDYDDSANNCLGDCTCEDNVCINPTVTSNDPRCTECQTDEDCNSLDNDYCDIDLVKHDEGKCVNYACETETTTTQDCNANDNNYCDGALIKNDDYRCDAAACILDSTTMLQDCDNNLYCDGAESCENALCVAGIAPTVDDGLACTIDNCDEDNDVVTHTPDDSLCDDGLWCNGAEYCDVISDCQAGTAQDCSDGIDCTIDVCDEDDDVCVHDDTPCNNPPTHDDPILESSEGTDYIDEDLICSNQATSDLDGDPVTNSYEWYKDSVLILGQTSNQIASSLTSAGDVWQCSVTPNDGIEDGETKSSNTLTIGICPDTDEDDVCDNDELAECVGQTEINIPGNESCVSYSGFNYLSGCWVTYYNVSGEICGRIWNYKCEGEEPGSDPYGPGSDPYEQLIESQCDGAGTCIEQAVVFDWPKLPIQDCSEGYYCDYDEAAPPPICVCYDTDNDNVCDVDEGDGCLDDHLDNIPENTLCTTWDLGGDGCHEPTYADVDTILSQVDCSEHEYWDDVEGCYEFINLDTVCGAAGEIIEGTCAFNDVCGDEPDARASQCALYLNKDIADINCVNYGDSDCWVKDAGFDSDKGKACCGDDVTDTTEECWVGNINLPIPNGCCWSNEYNDVVYMTEPDDAGPFCNVIGIEKLGFNPGDCDEQYEQYCFAKTLPEVSQDPNCCCCGDDPGETWNIFKSGYDIGDVIVGARCENGKWVERTEIASTLYNIWTYIIS